MLIIEDNTKAKFADVILTCVENGSFMSLMEALDRLNRTRSMVKLSNAFLGVHLEFAVTWYLEGEDPKPFMLGGLVYHPVDNSWGTHT